MPSFLTAPTKQHGAASSFEAMHAVTAMDAGMSTTPGRRGQKKQITVVWHTRMEYKHTVVPEPADDEFSVAALRTMRANQNG